MGSPRAAMARAARARANQQNDPDKLFAEVSQRGFDRYEREFKPFEVDVLARAQSDTSLIDAVPEDTAEQQRIAEAVSYTHLTLPTIYSV